ncbi:MAG: serine--tRNA ligase, partial [Candidatus Omnitrophica bacterium]|nr:serine--tRNA ligase [Candidatus Omnitrophota bacterium]
MLDIKFIRENPDKVKTAIKNRNLKLNIEELLALDKQWRKMNAAVEELRKQRNAASDEMSELVKKKTDISSRREDLKALSQKIKENTIEVEELWQKIGKILLEIPNIPHNSVPVGKDSGANKVVKTWGEPKKLGFLAKTHVELVEYLDIIDLPRAAKITGANFVLFKGKGALLERALISFMLGLHTKKHGYLEISPPLLVNRASMVGTGQLPKLEEDMYRLREDDLFLIPTAEVPVTNIHRDEILNDADLPLYYTAYTPCFRREAGSYGKDTKGLSR